MAESTKDNTPNEALLLGILNDGLEARIEEKLKFIKNLAASAVGVGGGNRAEMFRQRYADLNSQMTQLHRLIDLYDGRIDITV